MPKYCGGCHCGGVRFEFEAPESMTATDCNCSVCSMTGFLHVFIPHADFTLLTEWNAISTYTFNTGQAKHHFCSNCGVKSFYQPRSHPECFSVNFHCIQPGTLQLSDIIPFDGGNWDANIDALRSS